MMFGSETIPRDTRRNSGTSFLFSSNNSNFKHVSVEGEFLKSKELMGTSDNMSGNQNQTQHIQQSCGLARYRSAPGSFIGSLLESSTENSVNGEESEAFFRALMENGPLDLNQKDSEGMQYFTKQETRNGKNEFGGGEIVGSYSVGMEMNINASNLGRQSSSRAEFYSGFGIMGELGNYRVQNRDDLNPSSSGCYRNHMEFSSPPSSTSRFMPSITENGKETHSSENGGFWNRKEFESPSTQDSWNDHPPLNGFKGNEDGERKKPFSNLNGLGNPNEETRKRSPGLVHHLSLPKSSAQAQMANGQKFLHFQQDTVPCQTRAKRGFATHPRSIAERMRRTRISEKMKKLQDLFPNMDKQTNTADMLDLAVEHIKDLQKQVMTLTDARAKCACSSKRKPTSSTT